jgi:pimeloyl-ACP methyl ester carboxylesterase
MAGQLPEAYYHTTHISDNGMDPERMKIQDKTDVACLGAASNTTNTIVALHGIQGTRASWQPLAHALSGEVRWVLPNLQGRGNARRGATTDDYSLDAFASETIAVIEQHALTQNYVLAGWSMGVSVAIATVARLQEMGAPLPRALVFMSGSPVLRQTSWFIALDDAALLQEIALRQQRLSLREAADHDAVSMTWQAIRNSDQRPLLPLLQQPTLIVHGADDHDVPASHARLLEQGLPQARLHVIPGAGHSILTQNTASVAQRLQAFLSELPALKDIHENK